jgi:Fe2+ or Zn2+ uptake regulation protein
VEFQVPDLVRLEEQLSREYGYTIITHQWEVKGYCRSCQAERSGPTDNG